VRGSWTTPQGGRPRATALQAGGPAAAPGDAAWAWLVCEGGPLGSRGGGAAAPRAEQSAARVEAATGC